MAAASKLTPQPHPAPVDCGLFNTLNDEPINSVEKSKVEPLSKLKDIASIITEGPFGSSVTLNRLYALFVNKTDI